MTPSRANAQRLQTASLQSLIHHALAKDDVVWTPRKRRGPAAEGTKQGDLF
jgi:hypothetical protein